MIGLILNETEAQRVRREIEEIIDETPPSQLASVLTEYVRHAIKMISEVGYVY